jgi:hypothetical protein
MILTAVKEQTLIAKIAGSPITRSPDDPISRFLCPSACAFSRPLTPAPYVSPNFTQFHPMPPNLMAKQSFNQQTLDRGPIPARNAPQIYAICSPNVNLNFRPSGLVVADMFSLSFTTLPGASTAIET